MGANIIFFSGEEAALSKSGMWVYFRICAQRDPNVKFTPKSALIRMNTIAHLCETRRVWPEARHAGDEEFIWGGACVPQGCLRVT